MNFFFKIVAGAHKLNFEFGHQKRSIESMEANSNFNMQELEDDISIITVTEPFDFSDPHVQPVDTFKTDDAEIPDGTTCVSTGKLSYLEKFMMVRYSQICFKRNISSRQIFNFLCHL